MEKEKPENGLLSKKVAEEYLSKLNEYGESSFMDNEMMLTYIGKISKMLKLDGTLASGIYVGSEMANTCYGDIGENFVIQKTNSFDRFDFAKTIIMMHMEDIPEDKKDRVLKGVSHVLAGKYSNNEELLVQIARYALQIGNTYTDSTKKNTFIGEYLTDTVKRSVESKRLKALKIKSDTHEMRSKEAIPHKQEKYLLLGSLYDYYDQGVLTLPEEYRRLEEEDRKKAISYFLVSRSEEALENMLAHMKARDIDSHEEK